MTPARDEFLPDQSRDFRDRDGRLWRVRIEQGGGSRNATADQPPVARLILRAIDDDSFVELSVAGDAGQWDLTSYSDRRLRALLAEAQAHAAESRAE